MKSQLLFFLTLAVCVRTFGQQDAERVRRTKIEDILRIQDTRTIHDARLVALLGDADPVVRNRATLACGSLQDTSLLPLLIRNLTDKDAAVQNTAAFAIGQTGVMLGERSRAELEHELLWTHLPNTRAADRMIGEIGKFGTQQGLEDIMVRTGNAAGYRRDIVMTITRFAIRGIRCRDAVRYLLRFVRAGEAVPDDVAYALQRTGDDPEIRAELPTLSAAWKHSGPIARMHLATLYGKLNEASVLDPLVRMAEFDTDWRVKVNALRALGQCSLEGKDYELLTFKRAFYDENHYVRLTAIAAFAATGVHEADSAQSVRESYFWLKRMAVNEAHDYDWQIQGEAVLALARLLGKDALPSIKPSGWPQRLLQGRILEALGETGDPSAASTLLRFANDNDVVQQRSALEGLHTLSRLTRDSAIIEQTYGQALALLKSDDVAIVTTAASLLGDSLFRRRESVDPLLDCLGRLRVPDDVEAIQEIAATLGKLDDPRAIAGLSAQLRQPDRSVVLASAAALQTITGRDYSASLPSWIQPLLTDFDFEYLRALPEPLHVDIETIRGTITCELLPQYAPFTVMSFLKLALQRGFYRGLTFHRVVPNFVIQGGDPRGDGWGGPGYSIRSEFSPLSFDTGVLGMASAGKDTEGSQFFITQSPQPHLDGRYTIFGRVIAGMDIVDQIRVDDRIFDVRIVP